ANNKGPVASDCASEAITVTPPQGMLVICKASTNGTTGTSFFFNVTDSSGATHPVTVGGGTCSDPLSLPIGTTTIQEDLSSGLWVVTEIDVSPTVNLNGTPDLQHGSVTVTLHDDETTTVTFTNKKAPPKLIVCKWTNAPTLLGQTFNF